MPLVINKLGRWGHTYTNTHTYTHMHRSTHTTHTSKYAHKHTHKHTHTSGVHYYITTNQLPGFASHFELFAW